MLDGWLAATKQKGVTEFDSPTYSEVDIETLLVARRAAPDDATRAKITQALDYLWSDFSASFFAGRGSLAGPLARTYDFLYGQGGLTVSLYLQGLRTQLPSQSADPSKAILWTNENDAAGYRPAKNALCLSSLPEREVLSTYGAGPGAEGKQRTTFITPDFTIGTTSSDYGASASSDQDAMVRAELASSPTTPAISVIPDYLDAPATTVQVGNFSKVSHLLMSPASAQKAGVALTLLRVPARDPKYKKPDGTPLAVQSLTTNVVFPLRGGQELIVDDVVGLDPQKDTTLAGARPTMTIRIGTGVVAVSVIDAGGRECVAADGTITQATTPQAHVKPLAAATAAHDGSARIALVHDASPPLDTSTLDACFARVALLIAGSHCDHRTCAAELAASVRAANAAATRTFDTATGDWDVSVRLGMGPVLHVHRVVGAAASEKVIAREVDGKAIAFPPLSVNGKLIAF